MDKNTLNKSELSSLCAEQVGISATVASRTIDAIMDAIIQAVKQGKTVQLIGFGSFSASQRAARSGRNPRTGEAIKISATMAVKFSAGKKFKEAVNKNTKKKK